MRKLFDLDSPLMSGLSIAADLLVLNLLALLCSLPVVTFGAAVAAMNDVCLQIARQEGSSVVRGYFRSFRKNFKGGLFLGLVFLATAVLLYFDYLAALTYVPPFRIVIAALAILALAVFEYAFALLSRDGGGLWSTLKNAAIQCVARFPRTLLMLMFTVGFWLACITFIRLLAPALVLFGLSLPCYVCCMLIEKPGGGLSSARRGEGDE